MRRRSKPSGASAKSQHRKAATPKRRHASNKPLRRGSSAIGKVTEVARLRRELTKALERQIATAEVLKVISSSPGGLQPIFDAILRNAIRICAAGLGILYRYDGNAFVLVAHNGASPTVVELMKGGPIHPHPNSVLGRIAATREVVDVGDATKDPGYLERVPAWVAGVEGDGTHSLLGVPMMNENSLIGALVIFRREIRPFTDEQIALLKSFAAQAVIAIENTRLLSELRQSLEQQTATAEVLRVISASPAELQPVFEAMLSNATRLCEANFGILQFYEDGAYRLGSTHNVPAAFAEAIVQRGPLLRPGPLHPLSRVAATKQLDHIFDYREEPAYKQDDPGSIRIVELGGARTVLSVPMLKDDELVGVIVIYRQEVRPFADKQIELLKNFAAQAVIAIENARLLNELRQRTDDLTRSLEELRTAQDRLIQTEKLASLGQLTAGIAHEIKNPLNFVNNFSALSVELIDELQDVLGSVTADDNTRNDITDLTTTLRGNLDKIVQHGKRADSIVKNMLLHSREGSGEHRPVDVNVLVEESLNLAYHGARAEKQGFAITLQRSFDPAAGEAEVFPQEITRALLNLIANGFYAASRRKAQAEDEDFEPTLAAATRNLGDRVEISIRDNGAGIPPEVKERMFNPFFTTKPAGEGTGLGLSISHDIVVKQHAGAIEVDTEPGAFTEIKIILQRAPAHLAKERA